MQLHDLTRGLDRDNARSKRLRQFRGCALCLGLPILVMLIRMVPSLFFLHLLIIEHVGRHRVPNTSFRHQRGLRLLSFYLCHLVVCRSSLVPSNGHGPVGNVLCRCVPRNTSLV